MGNSSGKEYGCSNVFKPQKFKIGNKVVSYEEYILDKDRKDLAKLLQYKKNLDQNCLPTDNQLSLINFDEEKYCTHSSLCNPGTIQKPILMKMYKDNANQYIQFKRDKIRENQEKILRKNPTQK
jgi:hypothetical protein